MARVLLFIFCLLGYFNLAAQFTYTLNQSIVVKDKAGKALSMPWAGGINGGQYNTIDINDDGKDDLLVFDKMANKVFTFLNVDGTYSYAPYYEDLFPAGLRSWVMLRDFNGDGKKDLFTRTIDTQEGFMIFKNTTQPGGKLKFSPFYFYRTSNGGKTVTVQTKGLSNYVNMQLASDDLPSIEDMDGDGDLDILVITFSATGQIEYHENFSERFHSLDSIEYELQTNTWGNVTECSCGTFAFNGTKCAPASSGRVQHAGGKSLLAMDVDNDNDFDLLFSEATCDELYLLMNEGTTANPVFNSASSFPPPTPVDNMRFFPTGYLEDVDFDGVRDMVVSPNIYSKNGYLSPVLDQSSWFYKNTGTNAQPVFTLKTKSFLQNQMIDVGDESVPAFADADGDGDFDLFVSQNFRLETSTSVIYYYENTGSATYPEFTLRDDDYLEFSQKDFFAVKIQFTDMNGDGKIDLAFLGSTFDDISPVLYYLPNSSSSGLKLSSAAVKTNIKIEYDENVHLSDVGGGENDKPDGKPDALIGRASGALEYWVNKGSTNFTLQNEAFFVKSGIDTRYPNCTTGDLDGDGKQDILITYKSGLIDIVSDYHSAKDLSSAVSKIVINPLLDSAIIERNYGGTIWPTFVNLFNTSRPAIVMGNKLGGLYVLENIGGEPGNATVQIYPNPVSGTETLKIRVNKPCSLQVFTTVGQRMNRPVTLSEFGINSIRVNDLASGIYFFRFTFGDKSITKRIFVN